MYEKNKNSLRGQPRFPRFKKKNMVQEIIFTKYAIRIEGNKIKLSFGVRIDIWTHFMRGCIIDYVH